MLSYTACPDSSGKSRKAGKTFLQTLFLLLLVTQICFAQWVQLGLEDKAIKDIAASNSTIFTVASDSGGLFRSTDNGVNWTQVVDTRTRDIAIASTGMIFMIKDSIPFYGFPTSSLLSSSDNGITWTRLSVTEQLPPPWGMPWPWNIAVSPTGLLVCGINDDWAFGEPWFTIALSIDNGVTWAGPGWNTLSGLITDFSGQNILTFGQKNFSGGGAYEIHISYDNGQNWIFLGGPPIAPINTLNLCSNGKIFTGGGNSDYYGFFMTNDLAQSWERVSYLIPDVAISLESVGILIGIDSLGVFLFSEDGDSLGSRNEGLTNLNIHSLTADNNGYVYAGTDNGVWRRLLSQIVPVELSAFTATSNEKEVILNWSTATELNNLGFEIQRSLEGKEFFTVGFVNGNGTTTEQHSYTYSDKNLDNGKYYYRLKQVDFNGTYEYSDVVEVEWRAFNSFLLEQNYPNPFNPTTTISFGLQNKSNVKITVLNATGEEVAVILNEEREAGYHKVVFNAANLPSGVYFYQLGAGSFVETKKMLLLK